MEDFLRAQIPFILSLQNLLDLSSVMKLFSALGSEDFFLILLPLVYLCFDSTIGLHLALILLMGDAVNNTLKLALHMPRPYWFDSRVQALSQEPTYALPSNHVQNATSIWFFIASRVNKTWAWATAGLMVLLISLSRLYLGMHFPSDVIIGWVVGGLFLFAFLTLEPRAKDWLNKLDLWKQVGVVLIATLAIMLVGIAIRSFIAGIPDPQAWASFSADARTLSGLTTDAGALFGVGLGAIMGNRWARFNAGGPIPKRVARLAIGLIAVGILYFGLRGLFPTEPEALGLILRFVRYALTTWVAIFGVPWLLLRIKLAEPL
jgi:membrane-associated phospholipid phosphatase